MSFPVNPGRKARIKPSQHYSRACYLTNTPLQHPLLGEAVPQEQHWQMGMSHQRPSSSLSPSSGLSFKAPDSGKPHFTLVGERLLPWTPKRPSVSPIIPHLTLLLIHFHLFPVPLLKLWKSAFPPLHLAHSFNPSACYSVWYTRFLMNIYWMNEWFQFIRK